VALTFDPFGEMDRLTQLLRSGSVPRAVRWMPMDLYRSGDHYVINVDLPGVDPGSIDLDVDGQMLSIRAQRTPAAEESVQWLAQERPAGSFVRQISLGEGLDVNAIHASYENGVLSLTIPVAEVAKPRKIQVQGAAGGQRQLSGEDTKTVQGESAVAGSQS